MCSLETPNVLKCMYIDIHICDASKTIRSSRNMDMTRQWAGHAYYVGM